MWSQTFRNSATIAYSSNHGAYRATVTVTDLLALSDYTIFCYSEDFDGNVMSTEQMLKTNITGACV